MTKEDRGLRRSDTPLMDTSREEAGLCQEQMAAQLGRGKKQGQARGSVRTRT